MTGESEYIVMGIISAIVAGNAQAVADMLGVLARSDPATADKVMKSLERGRLARAVVSP